MRKYLLLATTLLLIATTAGAQSLQSGSIGGMPYYLLPASGGCSAATPCSVVTYLGVQSESSGAIAQDVTNYFGGAFAQTNPHTIVIAPQENGPQDATTNWGGYNTLNTPEQQQMIAVVQGVEAQMGNTVNPAASVVTGGSLGGTGTQAALAAAGPKGLTTPGVFSAGVSFDAALWTASPAETAALCSVPLTAVHGTADTNQSISFDQNLASAIDNNPACGNSFTLVPVAGAGHGTWSGPSGYQAGTGPGTPLATIASDLNSAPPTTVAASPATAPPAATSAAAATPATAAATIAPDQGSVTDCTGNVWAITSNNKVTENGQPVLGGGDTSRLTLAGPSGCTVYGLSNGQNGSTTNWFTMSSSSPTTTNGWTVSTAPTGATTAAAATPTASKPATAMTPPAIATSAICGSGVPLGAFKMVNGRIIGPDGKDWIARGINVADNDMGAAAQMTAQFPGLNFVRLAVYKYQNPSAYAGFINTMTPRGTVVEIEHHVETNGATGGGGQGDVPSGAWLAQESAFYASLAAAFKANPYVWFGTTNEPPAGPGLSASHKATYDAIRNTGNQSPILIEPGGSRSYNLTASLDPSVYATMTNIVMDPHVYGYQINFVDDPAQLAANVAAMGAAAQAINSADGPMPAIIAEFGPSTTGMSMDSNGMDNVDAVLNSGGARKYGSAVWHWGQQDCCNNLNSGTTLTDLGQRVQLYINTTVQACTPAETAANAQTATTAITTAMAQDPTTPAIAAPTAANAIQAAQNATLVQQAQAAARSTP